MLQVRHNPFMCPEDIPRIIEEHERLAKAGDTLHAHVAMQLKGVAERGHRGTSSALSTTKALFRNGRLSVGALASAVWAILFNYNTVEAVLLFSAVQVGFFCAMAFR